MAMPTGLSSQNKLAIENLCEDLGVALFVVCTGDTSRNSVKLRSIQEHWRKVGKSIVTLLEVTE